MIPVTSLLYKIDQKLNKLSTFQGQMIPLEDKILSLNEAQIKLIKQKMDGTPTASGLGMDAFKKRYEDLQALIESHEDHPLILSLTNPLLNKYTASLKEVFPQLMFYMDGYVTASKGGCKKKRIWINPALSRHADLQIILQGEHTKPSFEYGETFAFISSDEISVFTDGSFSPTWLYLSYVRYPRMIDREGYIDLKGNPSRDQDCELALHLEDELSDLTVQMLSMYTENAPQTQAAQFRIQSSE